MKIPTGSPPPTVVVETADNKIDKASTPQQKTAAKPASKGDKVDFSASLGQSLKTHQELRAERLASIKSRISAGTYQISSREVAEKMLSGSLDF